MGGSAGFRHSRNTQRRTSGNRATRKGIELMPTYKGVYSPDPDFSTKCDDLAWMPGPRPNVYVRDTQGKTPGKQQIIPDKGGWADDFARAFPAQSPFPRKHHPKY